MHILTVIILLIGLLFFTGGTVGILRFPDFYSRLHPAGKLDTMGLLMAMAALALHSFGEFSIASLFTGIKIILIVIFVFITSPTATHAIIDAGVRAGLEPWTRGRRKDMP